MTSRRDAPLLGGPMRGRRRVLAGLTAAAAALLAVVCIAVVVQRGRRTSLVQVGPIRVDNIVLHHMEAPFMNLAKKGADIFQTKNFLSPPAPVAHKAQHQVLKGSAPPAKHVVKTAAAAATPLKGADHGVVYYYMPNSAEKGAKLAQSKLQHMASHVMLAAPPPGVIVAPQPGDGPQCDLWTLQTLSDNSQVAWDTCMTNKNYKEPNSIAQEIYDELDATEDGEVTPKEYCQVARKHTARLTDEQCKEIIKLMDEAAGDNDGVLTFAEFKKAYLKGQEPPEEEEEEERRRRRHLLGWKWVPGQGVEVKKKLEAETFHTSTLATFKRMAVSMMECKTQALGDACEQIGKCSQPVCSSDTMYNDTKVEALCGMCVLAGEETEAEGATGCFALEGMVDVWGSGPVQIAHLSVGDRIAAAAPDGSLEYSRVLFTHEHVDPMTTVKLSVGGGVMELTSAHQVPVYTPECGGSYCSAAKLVKASQVSTGDLVYVSDGERSMVHAVSAIEKGQAHVKYIITEAGNLVVNGVVASVFSTMAKHLETLPFLALDSLFQGIFEWAPVKAALFHVLESPALSRAERLVDVVSSFKSTTAAPAGRATAMGFIPASA